VRSHMFGVSIFYYRRHSSGRHCASYGLVSTGTRAVAVNRRAPPMNGGLAGQNETIGGANSSALGSVTTSIVSI